MDNLQNIQLTQSFFGIQIEPENKRTHSSHGLSNLPVQKQKDKQYLQLRLELKIIHKSCTIMLFREVCLWICALLQLIPIQRSLSCYQHPPHQNVIFKIAYSKEINVTKPLSQCRHVSSVYKSIFVYVHMQIRACPGFEFKVPHSSKSTNLIPVQKHIFTFVLPLNKIMNRATKIGHIFRKQCMYHQIHKNCPQRRTPHFQADFALMNFRAGHPVLGMYADEFQMRIDVVLTALDPSKYLTT